MAIVPARHHVAVDLEVRLRDPLEVESAHEFASPRAGIDASRRIAKELGYGSGDGGRRLGVDEASGDPVEIDLGGDSGSSDDDG